MARLAQRPAPPLDLDDFVGPGECRRGRDPPSALAIAEDRVASAIFYGPPGTGKTTLARIVAATTGSGLRGALRGPPRRSRTFAPSSQRARDRLGGSGQRTILFLDEIHRFNKAQQDAMLPAVETGLVTLIGATTENPYFEVNSALLSRAQIYRAAAADERGTWRSSSAAEQPTWRPSYPTSSSRELPGGPAGTPAPPSTSSSSLTSPRGPRRVAIEERHVEDAARKRPLVYDKGGDPTTTSPPPSSSRSEGLIRMRRSSGSPRCSREVKIRGTWRGG